VVAILGKCSNGLWSLREGALMELAKAIEQPGGASKVMQQVFIN